MNNVTLTITNIPMIQTAIRWKNSQLMNDMLYSHFLETHDTARLLIQVKLKHCRLGICVRRGGYQISLSSYSPAIVMYLTHGRAW